MFKNREDAAQKLLKQFHSRVLTKPVVLGVPRGGMVLAAILAKGLDAELDVMLARKLRAPHQPELALGAIDEDGEVYLHYPDIAEPTYLEGGRRLQTAEIKRRRNLLKDIAPPIELEGRSVIVTDDGVATGSTLMAGLPGLRKKAPLEIILAVPIAPPLILQHMRTYCDEIYCLYSPADFRSVGEFYQDFSEVSDHDMLSIFRKFKDSQKSTPTVVCPATAAETFLTNRSTILDA